MAIVVDLDPKSTAGVVLKTVDLKERFNWDKVGASYIRMRKTLYNQRGPKERLDTGLARVGTRPVLWHGVGQTDPRTQQIPNS